jgi:hypothetical protein
MVQIQDVDRPVGQFMEVAFFLERSCAALIIECEMYDFTALAGINQ